MIQWNYNHPMANGRISLWLKDRLTGQMGKYWRYPIKPYTFLKAIISLIPKILYAISEIYKKMSYG